MSRDDLVPGSVAANDLEWRWHEHELWMLSEARSSLKLDHMEESTRIKSDMNAASSELQCTGVYLYLYCKNYSGPYVSCVSTVRSSLQAEITVGWL